MKTLKTDQAETLILFTEASQGSLSNNKKHMETCMR